MAISPVQTRHLTIALCLSVLILLAVGLCAPAGASARLLGPCPDTHDAKCGTVAVPLDRANPAMGTIPIFFRYVRHTGSGPVGDPIFTTEGGPWLCGHPERLAGLRQPRVREVARTS